MSHTALKYDAEVQDNGRLELTVPLPAGARVIVFVIEESDSTAADLVAAAKSSVDFWDNPLDDEDWNNDSIRHGLQDIIAARP